MSYVGLFSYYNFDNWAYQPSYVSSNTPWFFEGIRIQIFPTHHLKIEPWIINGWQSYASANTRKGLGGQIKYTPFPWMNIVSNKYGLGHDDLYTPNRSRIHTDNSIEIKYYDKPGKMLDKMALTFTGDLGCEFGGGVSCYTNKAGGPKQSFIGYMIYNKFWFHKDMYSITVGGGQINNPGRYLVLIPPINGETAGSAAINSPYFTFNPGDPFKAWDTSVTFDYMPKQWVTLRFEGDYRHANVPYWSGAGGVTPPPFLGGTPGTNNGYPTQYVCMDGTPAGTSLTPGSCSAERWRLVSGPSQGRGALRHRSDGEVLVDTRRKPRLRGTPDFNRVYPKHTREGETMFKIQKITLSITAVTVTFAIASFVGSAVAQQKSGVPKVPDKLALSTDEVKQLVLMMDTDKSGKISKKEFMDFMSAEFDRLDTDKSGELDVKELAQSQFRPSARPSTGK